jgi:hypothetical protein
MEQVWQHVFSFLTFDPLYDCGLTPLPYLWPYPAVCREWRQPSDAAEAARFQSPRRQLQQGSYQQQGLP